MEIINRINQLRANTQAFLLGYEPEMARIAQERAQEMAEGREPFSHFRSDSQPGCTEKMEFNEIRGEVILVDTEGQNQGFSFSSPGNVDMAVSCWENSPPHREVLENPEYRAAGFGVAQVGNITCVVGILSSKRIFL